MTAQIKWEPAYFIDNSGVRTECLIQDRDWNDNPTNFSYKLTDTDAEAVRGLADTKEFGIPGISKYVRAEVNLDQSSNKIGSYQTTKEPVFIKGTFFLRVLVQGDNTLYGFSKEGLHKYFYQTKTSEITPLVYVKYRQYINYIKGYEENVRENNQYKNDLWNDVKCPDANLKDVEKLKYKEAELIAYFKKANACNGSTEVAETFEIERKKGNFNLKIGVGYNSYGYTITRNIERYSVDLSGTSIGFGVEAEYILPTNKNKWAAVIEANYNNFEGEQELESNTLNGEAIKVKHTFIQVPIGMRHYMFLNDTSKIMLTGALAVNMVSGSSIDYRSSPDLPVSQFVYNFGLGIGYEYKRISAEFRYYTPMGISKPYDSSFSKTALTLRFRVL